MDIDQIYKYSNDLMCDFHEDQKEAIAVVDAYDIWDRDRSKISFEVLCKKWKLWFMTYIDRYPPGDD